MLNAETNRQKQANVTLQCGFVNRDSIDVNQTSTTADKYQTALNKQQRPTRT